MKRLSLMSGGLARLLSLWTVLTLLAGSMVACTTTTTGADGRETRAPAEPADPERRARVRLELAGLYFSRGQADTALSEVKLAMAAKPDLADAHAMQALILASLGDNQLAQESFQRALQLAPQDGGTMHNYGWFLCQQRRFTDAEVQFNAALALPQYRDITRTLMAQGVCQARAGLWSQAERTLSRSFELDSGNPVTAFNLSEVLLHRGELERARFYVARINAQPEQVSAQSLWLAARIERRLGNVQGLQDLGRKLGERYPQAPETLLFERGRFDD
jgi:type IV pilus assembly protein PilF